MTHYIKCNILSIDAWAEEDGWTWNNWHKIDEFKGDITNDAECLELLKQYIRPEYQDKVELDDDQYNLVLVRTYTRQPLFAIEYGNAEEYNPYYVDVWQERDRIAIHVYKELSPQDDESIASFIDDDVVQLVEDGFLDPRDYHSSALEYCRHLGLIK